MKSILAFLCSVLLVLSASCAAAAGKDFAGTYEGASVRKSKTSQSLVVELTVNKAGDGYSLTGSMNDTNREEGMDHTSNTFWQWTGTGRVSSGSLVFTYTAGGDDPPRKGTLRSEKGGLILTLDDARYRLHASRPDSGGTK